MPDETDGTAPSTPPSARSDAPALAPKSDATIYDLEPAPPPPPPAPPPAHPPAHPVSKLSDKGLTDDFPEDADFSHDPEVDKALKGDRAETNKDDTVDEDVKPEPPFVKPGMGSSKTIALVGLGLAIAAVIAGAVDATNGWFSAGVLALYFTVIHAITGVGAVAAAAHLNDQPMGPIDLAAARMLAAVSMFMFLLNVHVTSYHFISPIFAAGAYWITLTILFRIPAAKLFILAIIHAGFATFIWVGMAIYSWAALPLATPK